MNSKFLLCSILAGQFIFSTKAQAQINPTASTAYEKCEAAYSLSLENCKKDSGLITNEVCTKNIADCKAKCSGVTGADFSVAKLHIDQCSKLHKASPGQKAVENAVQQINRQQNSEEGNAGQSGGGIFKSITGTLSTNEERDGSLSIKEIKAGIKVPIGVAPAPKAPPASK